MTKTTTARRSPAKKISAAIERGGAQVATLIDETSAEAKEQVAEVAAASSEAVAKGADAIARASDRASSAMAAVSQALMEGTKEMTSFVAERGAAALARRFEDAKCLSSVKSVSELHNVMRVRMQVSLAAMFDDAPVFQQTALRMIGRVSEPMVAATQDAWRVEAKG